VKAEKPQIGNPRKLTFWQHVFPARSIERFAGDDGNVAVKHRQSKREFRIPPDDKLFCAQRVWDQRAEAGYMKQIEDEFQTLADEIIAGLNQIGPEKSRIATKFFALWCSRFRQRNEPTPDHFVEGSGGSARKELDWVSSYWPDDAGSHTLRVANPDDYPTIRGPFSGHSLGNRCRPRRRIRSSRHIR
jgi:hypothetical protein